MRRLIVLSCCIAAIVSLAVPAAAAPERPPEPTATFTVPPSYTVKRIVLFPFEIPAYVMRGVTWPIGALLHVMEQKHVVERTADLLSNKEKTFWVYPVIQFGAGSSFGGGLGFHHTDLFHKGYELKGWYKIHVSLNQEAAINFAKPNAFMLLDRPVSYNVGVNWKRELDQDFYGLGPGSVEGNHARFRWTNFEEGVDIPYEVFPHFSLLFHVGGASATTSPSTEGGNPSVNTLFPPNQIPGFGRWISHFRAGFGLEHDTRDNPTLPFKGGLRRGWFRRYQHVGSGNFSFNDYRLLLTQYFPLWRPGLVLMIRNAWHFTQPTGGSQVPFYRLAVLDAGNMLRGFSRGRFHDRASVVFNVEYRYPIWRGIEGVLLYDTGRVFHGPSDFSFKQFKYSAGGGLNLHFFQVVLARFRVAYGGEGVKIMLNISKED